MRSVLVALLVTSLAAPCARAQLSTPALLDTIESSSFRYFWEQANPANGLIRDRSESTSPCSIASLGFGLSAICVGIDHGWVTRNDGAARVRAALQTLWTTPQGTATTGTCGYKGLYYHFLDMNTGTRAWTSELSTIDTALLFAGVLDCRQYFTGDVPAELDIRALADSITRRADWHFMQPNAFEAAISMGWKPESGFSGFGNWIGYNEAMILQIIALGSPTHPALGNVWARWTSGYSWQTTAYSAVPFVVFPPLFGHQYSHCWIDFQQVRDAYMTGKGITYFENSRRATLAQRNYSIANPLHWVGYSDSLWGITAGDDPSGYTARGAPPSQNDDGTISPTAAVSSIPFAPTECITVARNMFQNWGNLTWTAYGFIDAFNPTQSWYDFDVLGIDQGPMVLMIENYRTGAVWSRMMQNPDILRGLQAAGFTSVTAVPRGPDEPALMLEAVAPDPVHGAATLRFRLAQSGRVRIAIHDVQGRLVATPADRDFEPGPHAVTVDLSSLHPGVYLCSLTAPGGSAVRRFVRVE